MLKLIYLFKVEYKDGTTYSQNEQDVSVIDKEKSCYYDIKLDEVKTFSLIGEHTFSVNLEDGHFEVDGVPFKLHEEKLTDFRLVFWRRHTHKFNENYEELSHNMVYRFGWQTTYEGKNIQRVMEIK